MEMPDQTEEAMDDSNESEVESCDNAEPSTHPASKHSSESPPSTSSRYPLRTRAGGVQPPNRFM